MANQDKLTFGGIGKDPSGAYTQIETGFDPTYTDGVVQWKPTSATSVVSDSGETYFTIPFTGSDVTVNTGVTVTLELAHTGTVNTTEANHSIKVTDADGGNQSSGALLGTAEITSDGTNVTIVWTSGTDALGASATGSITILSNPIEPVTQIAYGPVSVVGAHNIKISSPVTANAEITAQFQWSDGDDLSIDGVVKNTWTNLGAQITHSSALSEEPIDPSTNAGWGKLDKMKFIRLLVTSTDANTDGTIDAALDDAYIEYELKNTLESNTGVTIGGIGKDPS